MKANTLYKLDAENSEYADHKHYYEQQVDNGFVLCLGEITNAPGHYALLTNKGQCRLSLPAEIFKECVESDFA